MSAIFWRIRHRFFFSSFFPIHTFFPPPSLPPLFLFRYWESLTRNGSSDCSTFNSIDRNGWKTWQRAYIKCNKRCVLRHNVLGDLLRLNKGTLCFPGNLCSSYLTLLLWRARWGGNALVVDGTRRRGLDIWIHCFTRLHFPLCELPAIEFIMIMISFLKILRFILILFSNILKRCSKLKKIYKYLENLYLWRNVEIIFSQY